MYSYIKSRYIQIFLSRKINKVIFWCVSDFCRSLVYPQIFLEKIWNKLKNDDSYSVSSTCQIFGLKKCRYGTIYEVDNTLRLPRGWGGGGCRWGNMRRAKNQFRSDVIKWTLELTTCNNWQVCQTPRATSPWSLTRAPPATGAPAASSPQPAARSQVRPIHERRQVLKPRR